MSATDCLEVMQAAAEHCSNARTALDDPAGLPDVGDLIYQPAALQAYAIEQLDAAINLLVPS